MIVLGEGPVLTETLPSGPGQADLNLESGGRFGKPWVVFRLQLVGCLLRLLPEGE